MAVGAARGRRAIGAAGLVVLAIALLAGLTGGPAAAQQGPGGAINPQRDCQTVRTCNYARNGAWRGCVSSYTCRTCRLVPAACSFGGASIAQRRCHEMRCGWGG